jgi:glutamate racemase
MDARPVGVFDSGVGGLTVLRALRAALPGESFLYLGDTARLPYGTKSAHTVVRYAVQAAEELVERGIKCLVVACNTASAAALDAMHQRFGELPLIGVIEPGAAAAVRATHSGRIAVLATDGTIRGGAYTRAIARLAPGAAVSGVACGLFVALAEEGWVEGPVAEAAAERYLAPLRDALEPPDTLVLGCTHFPVLEPVIARCMGPAVRIVDSAATTAAAVAAQLAARALLAPPGTQATLRCLATDGSARFAAVGARFLGAPLAAEDIELIDL